MKTIELQTSQTSALQLQTGTLMKLMLILLAMVGIIIALEHLPFTGVDWHYFQQALVDPWQVYQQPNFFYPPWMIWILAPLTWLPYSLGINRLLMILVLMVLIIKRGGRWTDIALLATSMPFLFLIANANIDWLPALAFLIEPKALALPFLLLKPQAGALAAVVWIRKQGGWIVLPSLMLLALSFGVYGNWIAQIFANVQSMEQVGLRQMGWNASFFPWTIPLGLWLLYKAFQQQDEFLGVSATLALAPYFALYTLTLWFALLLVRPRGAKYMGWITWVLLWSLYAFKHLMGVSWA